ncbi:hypothetical protein B0H14DRAFT_2775560 [Mycena olivaceomarginata]|nr:hypothetical protein B0H14DRAFT_2775560 [Mycena olivaceomarginata]
MVSILQFVFLLILSVQSLPTPDISLDLDSSINFNATGNSSALIDVQVSVKNVAPPIQGIKGSADLTGCTGNPSASLRPITSSKPTTSSSLPRPSGLPQSVD